VECMKKISRLPKGDGRILVVDIETKGPDIKGRLRKNIPKHEITVGVISEYGSDQFDDYWLNTVDELVSELNDADVLVSHNGEGFDFLVLEKYGLDLKQIVSYDLFRILRDKTSDDEGGGCWWGLNDLSVLNLGEKKYATGKELLDETDPNQLVNACISDVNQLCRLVELLNVGKLKYSQNEYFKLYPNRRNWNKKARFYEDYPFWKGDWSESGFVDDGETRTAVADFGRPLFDNFGKRASVVIEGSQTENETSLILDHDNYVLARVEYQVATEHIIADYTNLTDFVYIDISKIADDKRVMEKQIHAIAEQISHLKCSHSTSISIAQDDIFEFFRSEMTDDLQIPVYEIAKICENCDEVIELTTTHHHGWGAGMGSTTIGRIKCECGGCKSYEREDTPGFRDRFVGKCCTCGK
jgi:hypothetical protein